MITLKQSIWSETITLPSFEPLRGDRKTDVLIIGGGLAGILCAYQLRQAGVDCVLTEAGRLCSGITKNTTAKITSQHGLIYHKLLRRFGAEKTRMYLEANQSAVNEYRRLCQDIPCDFQEQDNYVYALNSQSKLEKELNALDRLHFPAQFADGLPLPFPTAGAVKFPHQAQFHPLRFVSGLLDGLQVYEMTMVREMVGTTAVTGKGKIRAEKVIAATHFPFLNKHGSYFLKLYQHRSYVLALEGAPLPEGMYVDESGKGLSFRTYGGTLLLGGGAHRTGKPGGNWAELTAFARDHYLGARELCRWATQDCMSLDGVPYIGRYSRNTPDLYVATGFNKWGMTSSMVAAMLLRDLVQGKESPWADVFDPSRSILRPQLAVNGFEAVTNLLTPTKKRCPHLGCALKWNPQERSWDCPCHGSRFTKDGELIDNPATGDLPRK